MCVYVRGGRRGQPDAAWGSVVWGRSCLWVIVWLPSLLVNGNTLGQHQCQHYFPDPRPVLLRLGQATPILEWPICRGDDVIPWLRNFLICEQLNPSRCVCLLFTCQSSKFKQLKCLRLQLLCRQPIPLAGGNYISSHSFPLI